MLTHICCDFVINMEGISYCTPANTFEWGFHLPLIAWLTFAPPVVLVLIYMIRRTNTFFFGQTNKYLNKIIQYVIIYYEHIKQIKFKYFLVIELTNCKTNIIFSRNESKHVSVLPRDRWCMSLACSLGFIHKAYLMQSSISYIKKSLSFIHWYHYTIRDHYKKSRKCQYNKICQRKGYRISR